MWRWFKWLLIGLGTIILLFGLFIIQPWDFLPHKHIEIGLPIKPEDDATTSLIPMGEKIAHNASNGTPDGHPGLDFGGWNNETDIISVADGLITRIIKIKTGTITVEIQSGYYRAVYQELNSIEPDLHLFSKVKKGQLIGRTDYYRAINNEKKEFPSSQLHWDFGSSSLLIDRLCPLNYFDADARRRIEAIWAKVPSNDQFKSQYPEICNGVFKDKED